MDKDPDVRLEALFVVGKTMPVEVAKKKKESMPYNWQSFYFFLSKLGFSVASKRIYQFPKTKHCNVVLMTHCLGDFLLL